MVGYSPDAFGHIAHLPAILRGFGIDSALIWRGVGPRGDDVASSAGRSPDGSEVMAVHFPYGYGMMPTMPEDAEQLRPALNSVRGTCSSRWRRRASCWCRTVRTTCRRTTGLSGVIRKANELLDDATMVHGDYPQLVANDPVGAGRPVRRSCR